MLLQITNQCMNNPWSLKHSATKQILKSSHWLLYRKWSNTEEAKGRWSQNFWKQQYRHEPWWLHHVYVQTMQYKPKREELKFLLDRVKAQVGLV